MYTGNRQQPVQDTPKPGEVRVGRKVPWTDIGDSGEPVGLGNLNPW